MTSHIVIECERPSPKEYGVNCERRLGHNGWHYCIVRADGRDQELVEWDDDGTVMTVELP